MVEPQKAEGGMALTAGGIEQRLGSILDKYDADLTALKETQRASVEGHANSRAAFEATRDNVIAPVLEYFVGALRARGHTAEVRRVPESILLSLAPKNAAGTSLHDSLHDGHFAFRFLGGKDIGVDWTIPGSRMEESVVSEADISREKVQDLVLEWLSRVLGQVRS